ncbi:MAG: OmpH family outer membrane protein [Rickettsiales bacterium]|jgi:Skp family chaperone for outer membrane proteins|nr:OmpH family outer membrane protein [Rickettsiales bacterium]
MKKLLASALFVISAAVSSAVRAEGSPVGVMDAARITEEAKVMKSLNGQRDDAVKKIRADVEAKKKEFSKRQDELASKQTLMSEEAFMKEAAKFQSEFMEYDRQTAARVGEIEKAYLEAVRKVQRDYLDGIVKKIGKERGYGVVVNTQAAVPVDSSLDITDEVVDGLDSKIKEMKLGIK